jgi:hypothetical protein
MEVGINTWGGGNFHSIPQLYCLNMCVVSHRNIGSLEDRVHLLDLVLSRSSIINT